MPKLKTRKGVKKRFKLTKKGKVKRARAGKGHILTKKGRKRKRGLKSCVVVDPAFSGIVKKLLPYG